MYCDRIGDEPFSVSALQLLTYVAGQTLETLPVRKRKSTATLTLADVETAEPTVSTAPPAPPAPAEPEVEAPPAEPAGPMINRPGRVKSRR